MSARREKGCEKGANPLHQARKCGLISRDLTKTFWLGCVIVFTAGCGGAHQFAPVSGRVTLNGSPLNQAFVSFIPIPKEGSIEAGEGSTGKTNEKGEFTLSSSTGKKGALVGKHRVSIIALNAQVGEHDTRPPRGGWPHADKVPTRYNAKTELTFDVSSGGSNKADFDLKSP